MTRLLPLNPGTIPQTLTVQYDDVTALDGTSESRPFSRDESDESYLPPSQDGIYRVQQDGPLGLIDPDLGSGGSMGDRYILWMEIVTEAANTIHVDIVDAEGLVALRDVIATQVITSVHYRSSYFRVPQGGLIRLQGDPGIGVRVRLRIALGIDECCGVEPAADEPDVILTDPFALNALDFGVPSDGTTDATAEINAFLAYASAASATNSRNQRVRFPTGDYVFGSDIIIASNIEIWGDGPRTRFVQRNGASMVFPQNPLLNNNELQHFTIQGQQWPDPVGIGLDMRGALRVTVREIAVWDFDIGIRLSDGDNTIYSAYNQVGPGVQVNRCTTGLFCGHRGNGNRIESVRVFYSYTPTDSGVGIDIDSPVGLSISNLSVDGGDICMRVRSTDFYPTKLAGDVFFLETGINPFTANPALATDIDITDVEGAVVNLTSVYLSAFDSLTRLDPEGPHRFDAPVTLFFGGFIDGASTPRRNWVYNGMFQYFSAGLVPGLVGGSAPVPTYAEVTTAGDFVTGQRSLRMTSAGANGSLSMIFEIADNGVRWLTASVRYRVEGANTGFLFGAQAQGGASHQHVDDEPTPAGQWRVGTVSFEIDPSNSDRSGSVSIVPDITAGGGSVLIDEIWVVPGRFSVPSTQYGERIEMLPSPIPIYTATLTALEFFGPIDILDLYNTLAPPLDGFTGPPYGVVGCVLRLRVTTDSGGLGTALASFHGLLVTIPGSAGVIADGFQRVVSQYSQIPTDGTVLVRDTTLNGLYYPGDGLSSEVEIALVGWITQ